MVTGEREREREREKGGSWRREGIHTAGEKKATFLRSLVHSIDILTRYNSFWRMGGKTRNDFLSNINDNNSTYIICMILHRTRHRFG